MSAGAEEFDWDGLMRFGLGALGLAPQNFWDMTPREFDAAVKGRMGEFTGAMKMKRGDFADLAARFPDGAPSA